MFNKKTDVEIILDSLNQVANNKELSSRIVNDLISRGIGSKKENKMQNKNFNKYQKILTDKYYENINESQTIDWLIAPMLRDLFEWDREDPEEVKAQWRKLTDGERENPVDFALFVPNQTKPIALVEAKRLNEKLIGKPVSQAISYCISANVRWAILTNGLEWKVYDALDLSKDELTDRLLFQVNILDFIENRSGMNNVDLISKTKIESLEQIIQNQKIKSVVESFFDLDLHLNLFSEFISNQTKYKVDSVKEILKDYCVELKKKQPAPIKLLNWQRVTQELDPNTKLTSLRVKTKEDDYVFDFKNWTQALENIVSFLFDRYDKLQMLYSNENLKQYISTNKQTLQKDYVLDSSIKQIKGGFLSTHSATQTKLKLIIALKDYLNSTNETVDYFFLES